MKGTHRIIRKKVVITSIMILIALTHFFTGSNYKGPYPGFVNGYLLDILVPFGFYFLLCLIKFPLLKSWIVRSILVFGAASFTEIAQFFGVPIFGQTFNTGPRVGGQVLQYNKWIAKYIGVNKLQWAGR